jgi:hypothetical protein
MFKIEIVLFFSLPVQLLLQTPANSFVFPPLSHKCALFTLFQVLNENPNLKKLDILSPLV